MNFQLRRLLLPDCLRSGLATAAASAVIACSVASPATAAVIDISGVQVFASVPTDLNAGLGAGTVSAINFDFSVEHFGSSWGQETDIEIIAPSSASYVFDGFSFFGFGVGGGVWTFSGSAAIGPEAAPGNWTLRFTDSFPDGASPNHVYLSESTIELVGADLADPGNGVPEPGTIGLALGGVAGLALLRRRRRSD